ARDRPTGRNIPMAPLVTPTAVATNISVRTAQGAKQAQPPAPRRRALRRPYHGRHRERTRCAARPPLARMARPAIEQNPAMELPWLARLTPTWPPILSAGGRVVWVATTRHCAAERASRALPTRSWQRARLAGRRMQRLARAQQLAPALRIPVRQACQRWPARFVVLRRVHVTWPIAVTAPPTAARTTS